MTGAEREEVIVAMLADADAEMHDVERCAGYDLTIDQTVLYWASWDAVIKALPGDLPPVGVISLEAAALMIEGWNYGDPVELL